MDNLDISWVFELAINPGRFEDLKTLMVRQARWAKLRNPDGLMPLPESRHGY
jgi:hypothetical protein